MLKSMYKKLIQFLATLAACAALSSIITLPTPPPADEPTGSYSENGEGDENGNDGSGIEPQKDKDPTGNGIDT